MLKCWNQLENKNYYKSHQSWKKYPQKKYKPKGKGSYKPSPKLKCLWFEIVCDKKRSILLMFAKYIMKLN